MGTENDSATIMASVDSVAMDVGEAAKRPQGKRARRAVAAASTMATPEVVDDCTTVLPDVAQGARAKLAWSCEDDEAPNNPATAVNCPDMSLTESAEWSGDEALERLLEEPAVPRRSPWPFLRWCLAITAVLITAAAVMWFGTDFYHEEESPSSATPSLTTPIKPAPTARPAPAPTTAPTPPLVMAPLPPAHDEVPPPPPPPPAANVNPQTIALYNSLLSKDGMQYDSSVVDIGTLAQLICANAAAGDFQMPVQYSLPNGTEPANWRKNGVRDTIQAFCPQYAN